MEARQLKFRAWDKVKNVMLYDVAVYSTGSGGMEYEEALEAYGSEDNLPEEQGEEWVFLLQHVFMQYTGIKEDGKQEIYEGDIVNLYRNRIGVVAYHEERAMFIIQDGFNEPLYQFYPIKVIGNIYENPELLNQSRKQKANNQKNQKQ